MAHALTGGERRWQRKSLQTRKTCCASFGGIDLSLGQFFLILVIELMKPSGKNSSNGSVPPHRETVASFHGGNHLPWLPSGKSSPKVTPNQVGHNGPCTQPLRKAPGLLCTQPGLRAAGGPSVAGAAGAPHSITAQVGYLSKRRGDRRDILALREIRHLLCLSFSQNIGDEFANGPGL